MFTVLPNNPKTIEDYEQIVAVYNQAWPDNLGTAGEWQHRDEQWPDTHLYQRFVVKLDDKLIAEGSLMETRWAHVPGKYAYGFSPLPDHEAAESDGQSIHDAVYAFLLDFLADRNPIALVAWTREDKTDYLSWLHENGFKQTMRYAESELDVQRFDSARFAGLQEQLAETGIEIVPLSELQPKDPDWIRKAYDMCTEIEVDIPSPDPATPEPFEQFEKGFADPNFLADGWFVAVDTTVAKADEVGPYVGVSMLGASQADPDKLYTWLTGVRRAYRRRSIALAAKVCAIEYAQRRGIKVIATDNEENNPMYQINLKLGFEPKPAWFDFEKRLDG